jgi:hypothetical protein
MILSDNGFFIKKFSKFVCSRAIKNRISISDFLFLLLGIEFKDEFTLDKILLLDINIRFLVLFYIVFSFIDKPIDCPVRLALLPSLNQCIYEFLNYGKCIFCNTQMIGCEKFENDYFRCNVCYYKHSIPETIHFTQPII